MIEATKKINNFCYYIKKIYIYSLKFQEILICFQSKCIKYPRVSECFNKQEEFISCTNIKLLLVIMVDGWES